MLFVADICRQVFWYVKPRTRHCGS